MGGFAAAGWGCCLECDVDLGYGDVGVGLLSGFPFPWPVGPFRSLSGVLSVVRDEFKEAESGLVTKATLTSLDSLLTSTREVSNQAVQ